MSVLLLSSLSRLSRLSESQQSAPLLTHVRMSIAFDNGRLELRRARSQQFFFYLLRRITEVKCDTLRRGLGDFFVLEKVILKLSLVACSLTRHNCRHQAAALLGEGRNFGCREKDFQKTIQL